MSRRRSKTKSHGPLVAAILLVLAVAGGLVGLHFWEQADQAREAQEIASRGEASLPHTLEVWHNGRWYQAREDLETVLVIGIDKYADRLQNVNEDALWNQLQSDFLFLLIADPKAGSYTALHINRDTLAEIPRIGKDGGMLTPAFEQLALSHTYGTGGKDSCRNSVEAVSRFLYNVPIDHYISVSMDAVPALTDLVGGVPVHVEDDFSAVTDQLPMGADVTLRGDLALTFVRGRWSVADYTNVNRMARQRAYINSLHDKLHEKLGQSESFALRLATTLDPYMVSDLITNEMADLAEQLAGYTFTGIQTIEGESKLGARYMEFTPDEDALQRQVLNLFFRAK
ncbi:MAG: LCP family protein [Oscillospiraceae bacterium]|nr:LCP family protein [Oscillospiraceae bacterium]